MKPDGAFHGCTAAAGAVADAFVEARRASVPLVDFPADLPEDLSHAYAIQLAATDRWPDRVAGWKVGRISGELEQRLGVNRFIGPIFEHTVRRTKLDEEGDFPLIAGGFSALEVELIAVVQDDRPVGPGALTPAEARSRIGSLHIGIEVAGSPLRSIHTLGALASIAGFGNNLGLIVGPEIPDFLTRPIQLMEARTWIDDADMGCSDAGALPGGIWAAVAFAFEQASRLGRPMRSGDFISTGALTGVHPVPAGQHIVADFGKDGLIRCVTVPVGRG